VCHAPLEPMQMTVSMHNFGHHLQERALKKIKVIIIKPLVVTETTNFWMYPPKQALISILKSGMLIFNLLSINLPLHKMFP